MQKNVMTPARRVMALALVTPLVWGTAACSGGSSSSTSSKASATNSAAPMASALQANDAWAKAADSGMSAAFGTLKNTGKTPITITKVSGEHGPMQLHVTQKTTNGMEMKETKSFDVPAGGSLVLKPGGSHMMFMNLSSPLKAGTTDTLRVSFKDGSTKTLDVPVRAYDGAKEKYSDGSAHGSSHHSSGMSDMSGMSHSSSH